MLTPSPSELATPLPVAAGWHRLAISGLADHELVELRLDFGLGFVGYHGVRARAEGGMARLNVRLFKPLRNVQLLRMPEAPRNGPMPHIGFEKISLPAVVARSAVVQLHLIQKLLTGRASGGRHDRPRRLWRWKGLQAFPLELPATGETSYALWRRMWAKRAGTPAQANAEGWLLLSESDRSDPTAVKSTNAAWVLLMQPDVVLDEGCLAAFAEAAAAAPHAHVIYSDNDFIDAAARRFNPELRTAFSPERLKSEDWLGGVVGIRAELLESAQARDSYAMSLAALDAYGKDAFVHIPEILYSRSDRPRTEARARRAADEWTGEATVIIPTRNRADLMQRCVGSILDRTVGARPEIIIHDNASDDPLTLDLLQQLAEREGIRAVRDELPFNFSRINNEAAKLARGDLLIFLNNDTEVISGDWIMRLGAVATQPDVGCAGPLLLDDAGRIQHAGLVTGPGGIAAHVHAGCRESEIDPVAPLVRRDVSAVTGACLAIEKSKFLAAGGFDAEGLAVAFNDVDLCLRLESRGYRNVFVPEVRLLHVGSATREDDDFTTGSDRFRAEFKLMRERWGPRLDGDPYFPAALRLTSTGSELRLA